jgi:nucleotide-binding universal stress UspA family protein
LEKVCRDALLPAKMVERVLVRYGTPFAEITDAARTLKADLIILTTHGYTGLKHVFMGSTAERVVRHAPCPVLTVREKEHEFV